MLNFFISTNKNTSQEVPQDSLQSDRRITPISNELFPERFSLPRTFSVLRSSDPIIQDHNESENLQELSQKSLDKIREAFEKFNAGQLKACYPHWSLDRDNKRFYFCAGRELSNIKLLIKSYQNKAIPFSTVETEYLSKIAPFFEFSLRMISCYYLTGKAPKLALPSDNTSLKARIRNWWITKPISYGRVNQVISAEGVVHATLLELSNNSDTFKLAAQSLIKIATEAKEYAASQSHQELLHPYGLVQTGKIYRTLHKIAQSNPELESTVKACAHIMGIPEKFNLPNS